MSITLASPPRSKRKRSTSDLSEMDSAEGRDTASAFRYVPGLGVVNVLRHGQWRKPTKLLKKLSSKQSSRWPMLALPESLGASCTSFLFIDEQCRLARTSKALHEYVKFSLRGARDTCVLPWDVRVAEEPSPLPFRMTRYHKKQARLVVANARACPRIGRFCYIVSKRVPDIQTPHKLRPVEFALTHGQNALGVGPAASIGGLAGLPCAAHLKELHMTMDVIDWVTSEQSMKTFHVDDLREAFPSLESVHINVMTLITEGHYASFTKFLEDTCKVWSSFREVHMKLGSFCWQERFSEALHKWTSLRALSIDCDQVLEPFLAPDLWAPQEFMPLKELYSFLPPATNTVTVRVPDPAWYEAAWQVFLEELLDSSKRKFPNSVEGVTEVLGYCDEVCFRVDMRK